MESEMLPPYALPSKTQLSHWLPYRDNKVFPPSLYSVRSYGEGGLTLLLTIQLLIGELEYGGKSRARWISVWVKTQLGRRATYPFSSKRLFIATGI